MSKNAKYNLIFYCKIIAECFCFISTRSAFLFCLKSLVFSQIYPRGYRIVGKIKVADAPFHGPGCAVIVRKKESLALSIVIAQYYFLTI